MTNALGPVVGNRIANANKPQTRPELQKRLNEQAQRSTPEGTFKTGADGRMEFVPKMAPTHNQQVLQRMRATKTEPTPEMDAKRATEEARSFHAEGDDEREAMGLRQPPRVPAPWAAQAKAVSDPLPQVLREAELAQLLGFAGVGKPAPAYDPLTAPLSDGDEVEIVGRLSVPQHLQGMRGKVCVMRDHPFIAFHTVFKVLAPDGGCYFMTGVREHLRLVAKASDCTRPVFDPGDKVMRTKSPNAGAVGVVTHTNYEGHPFVSFPGLGMACDPANLRLVKKAGA